MAEEADDKESSGASKKSIFTIMLNERKPVTTSQGTFYARHLSVGDMKTFAGYFDEKKDKSSQDLRALGELALKTLVSPDNDPEKKSTLPAETFSQLSNTDIELLIDGLIEASGLTPSPESKSLESLGSMVFDQVTSFIKTTSETAENIKRSMSSVFGSLSQDTMKSLVDSMSSLKAARDSLKSSPAVEAFRKIQEDNDRLFGNMAHKDLLGQTKAFDMSPHRIPDLYIPKLEETPIGRAAIASEESATQLREVAGLVGDMAEKLAKLHTVFLTEVIPQWVDSLEDNSIAMKTTLSQTEKSLFWAKWALIASVLVTVAMTVWQICIANDYKLENDKQQAESLLVMKEQLKASQELNKQLKTDAIQLKEELAALQQSVEKLNTIQSANLKTEHEAK